MTRPRIEPGTPALLVRCYNHRPNQANILQALTQITTVFSSMTITLLVGKYDVLIVLYKYNHV